MNDSLAVSTSDFAIRLLKNFHGASKNTLISPFGVLRPLAIFMFNSDGVTHSELTSTLLGSPKPSDSLMSMFNEQLSKAGKRFDGDWHHLKMAKFVYAHSSWPLSNTFTTSIGSQWQTTGKVLDLHTKNASRQINTDVAEQTRDKFDKMGSLLSPNSRLVAVNALDVKFLWSSPFSASETKLESFRVVYKDDMFMDCTVPMMSKMSTLPYYEDSKEGTKAVELKGTDHLSLVLILPKEGLKMSTFLDSFTGSKMLTIFGGLQSREVLFKLPHFKITKMKQMAEQLKSMGIKQLFTSSATFKSSMFTAEGNEHRSKDPIFLNDLLQGCQLMVSEEGTTANMSKPVGAVDEDSPFSGSSKGKIKEPACQLIANRAFLFVLLDKTSRQFLYFGVVEDPTQELKDLEYAD